jgi:hypothetical protein
MVENLNSHQNAWKTGTETSGLPEEMVEERVTVALCPEPSCSMILKDIISLRRHCRQTHGKPLEVVYARRGRQKKITDWREE